MPLNTYRELEAWQLSMDLVVMCYRLNHKLPRHETFGLGGQIRGAAGSVPANIAEGFGREHLKEYLHHLSISRGSLMELETHLIVCERVGYVAKEEIDQLLAVCERVSQMLTRLRQALVRRISSH